LDPIRVSLKPKKKKKKKVPLLEGIGIEFSVPIARDPDHEV
jgi:hypothetical protein